MPMIRKPLSDITKDDLDAICAQMWPEDEQLDFKSTIPHKTFGASLAIFAIGTRCS